MLQKIGEEVEAELRQDIVIHADGLLQFGSRLCLPSGKVRRKLVSEACSLPHSGHPGVTKIYRDLKQHFWWHRMKREIARFVAHCLVCQQVKAEHQRTAGLL